jgi:hypothetical protein
MSLSRMSFESGTHVEAADSDSDAPLLRVLRKRRGQATPCCPTFFSETSLLKYPKGIVGIAHLLVVRDVGVYFRPNGTTTPSVRNIIVAFSIYYLCKFSGKL